MAQETHTLPEWMFLKVYMIVYSRFMFRWSIVGHEAVDIFLEENGLEALKALERQDKYALSFRTNNPKCRWCRSTFGIYLFLTSFDLYVYLYFLISMVNSWMCVHCKFFLRIFVFFEFPIAIKETLDLLSCYFASLLPVPIIAKAFAPLSIG